MNGYRTKIVENSMSSKKPAVSHIWDPSQNKKKLTLRTSLVAFDWGPLLIRRKRASIAMTASEDRSAPKKNGK